MSEGKRPLALPRSLWVPRRDKEVVNPLSSTKKAKMAGTEKVKRLKPRENERAISQEYEEFLDEVYR